jgi:adenine phosphoribosyltransferase
MVRSARLDLLTPAKERERVPLRAGEVSCDDGAVLDLRDRLIASFRWIGDRTDPDYRADVSGWWRDPDVVASIGGALVDLFSDERPTVVMGTQSRGSLLGVLAARQLGVGFAEVRKDPGPAADSDAWWEVSTAPDYRDEHLRLGLRRTLLKSGDAVLFVDDWAATGAQAAACRTLVEMSGARWCGAAVVVDGLELSSTRRTLRLRSLLNIRDL